MRGCLLVISLGILGAIASARASITVTSYQTIALTNAYAPLDQSAYFDRQALTNTSPAVADVSDDWMGTNIGGTEPTWHWIGSAHTSTMTSLSANSLTISGTGSFSYDLTTTTGFVDPTQVTTVYGPAGGAGYESFFEINAPATYSVSVQLDQLSSITLASFENGIFFQRSNPSSLPVFVNLNGMIPLGHYDLRVGTGLGAPNLPNGINHYVASGSFSDFTFSVQLPEPGSLVVTVVSITVARTSRRRR